MVWPTVRFVDYDSYGNKLAESHKKIQTYVLPGDVIAFGSQMTVHAERNRTASRLPASEDPENYYPAEEDLKMPSSDSYQAGK